MSIPTQMRALEVGELGGPDAVALVDRTVPQPGPGEILLRVAAAGVNFADVMQTRGTYQGGPDIPYLAGLEVCGEVAALGDSDSPHPVGAKVFGAGLSGTFAEYVAAPAAMLQPLPEGWDEVQGAAFFVDWATAYACLKTIGRLVEGESVLIHAAAGGVGQAAVELAKHFGARVFATASTAEKLDIAKGLGADERINYVEQDFVDEIKTRTDGRGVDLILEMVGGETFHKNLKAVVPYGRIVVFGNASGEKVEITNTGMIWDYPASITGFNIGGMIASRPDLFGTMMAEIGELIAAGVIRPGEPTRHDLADGPRVLSDLEQRRTIGKHVLVP